MSCGVDEIPDIALKRAGEVVVTFLAILFKHCINIPVKVSYRIRYLGVILDYRFDFFRHIDFVLSRSKKVYLVYLYAFTVWFGISASQMELRLWILPDGSVKRFPVRVIYERTDFDSSI